MKFFNAITETEQQNTALQFNHKGWTISVSNFTPNGRCEVLAFNEYIGCDDIIGDSIPDIIEKINNL